jgi:hypothetical protein
MKKLISFVAGIVVPAFILAGGAASSAVAQGKAAMAPVQLKVLLENDKVRAFEFTQKPGQDNTSIASTKFRIVRAVKGGTIERTYADGKKETIVFKTGEVRMNEPGPGYTSKNIGKNDLHLYVVLLK